MKGFAKEIYGRYSLFVNIFDNCNFNNCLLFYLLIAFHRNFTIVKIAIPRVSLRLLIRIIHWNSILIRFLCFSRFSPELELQIRKLIEPSVFLDFFFFLFSFRAKSNFDLSAKSKVYVQHAKNHDGTFFFKLVSKLIIIHK